MLNYWKCLNFKCVDENFPADQRRLNPAQMTQMGMLLSAQICEHQICGKLLQTESH